MTDATRRGFLAAAGAGTVTVAAAAAAPGAAAAPAAGRGASSSDQRGRPLVAHVVDARSGKVCLLLDEHEVVVYDHDLVARLTRAAGR